MSQPSHLSQLSRYLRNWLKPEMILWSILVTIVVSSLVHFKSIQSLFRKTKLRFQFNLGVSVAVRNFRETIERDTQTDVLQVTPPVSSPAEDNSIEMITENASVHSIQGRRSRMEDRYSIVNDPEHTRVHMYGIFDGHGGEFAAEFVEKTLFKSVLVRLLKSAVDGRSAMNFSRILSEEILRVDKELLKVAKTTNDFAGTTALVALVHGRQLVVANVGDSRGILYTKTGKIIPISEEHKPQQIRERQRIKEAGGFISFNGVWRVAGILATSRALGDFPLKDRNLVIADPDVVSFDLDQLKADFMILASDGLWDFCTNEEAAKIVRERSHQADFGAKDLVWRAYEKGSMDNITVMVVKLSSFEKEYLALPAP